MRAAKAVFSLLVSASLAAPASAQVSAAVSSVGSASALPRVQLAVPLAPSAALTTPSSLMLAPAPSVFGAPALAASALTPLPAAALPAAAAAPAAANAPASASPATAAPAETASVAALARPDSAPISAVPSPAAFASTRWSWERFWTGAGSRRGEAPEVRAAAASGASPAALPRSTARRAPSRVAAAAAAVVPAAAPAHTFLAHAAPYLEAGALLAATYAATRGVHVLLSRFAAKKGMDGHQVAAIRLVADVVLWTGATAEALALGGASPQTMTAVFGAGGTILTLGLRDVLGNVIQGVNFLITRPFVVGQRVLVDDQTGTVADATMTMVLIRKDDGAEVKIRYAALASKPVIVFGDYRPEKALRLGLPPKPKFKGAASAVWHSLDRRFWIASAAFAALLAAPSFVPVLAAGWVATAVHYALAASLAWLTHRVELALVSVIDRLAANNDWSQETLVIARLAVRAALWALGGGAVLRMIGVSWTALGAGAGITTLGVGLATNNFFTSVMQGGEILFSKPFKVGDKVQIGTFAGQVEDMTLNHVVIKLDEGRHALVPYAVVRDATLVVTPGKEGTP